MAHSVWPLRVAVTLRLHASKPSMTGWPPSAVKFMTPWVAMSQPRHFFSSTATRRNDSTDARASGYDGGRRMEICKDWSSSGMLAVVSRVDGETLISMGCSAVDCEGAHALMACSSEVIINGDIYPGIIRKME